MNISTSKRLFVLMVVVVLGAVPLLLLRRNPSVVLATRAEIETALPHEGLDRLVEIPGARARTQQLVDDLRGLCPPKIGVPPDISAKIDAEVLAHARWSNALFNEALTTLNSGPLQFPSSRIDPKTAWVIKYAGRLFVATASARFRQVDFEESTKLVIAAEKLAAAFLDADGPLLEYLAALSVQFEADKAALRFAGDAGYPPSMCRTLLQNLPPSLASDVCLATAEQAEFREEVLPCLQNPNKAPVDFSRIFSRPHPIAPHSVTGFTFDAKDTAQRCGQLLTIEFSNTKKPWARFDDSASRLALGAVNGWPEATHNQPATDIQSAFSDAAFRQQVRGLPNYYGRMLLPVCFGDELLIGASINVRTRRNVLRVLLASRLYRSLNNWTLPPTPTGLLPYLGAWPEDLYDGKSLRYDPIKQVVYSVGKDLHDDGGDVDGDKKDNGVSLALSVPIASPSSAQSTG